MTLFLINLLVSVALNQAGNTEDSSSEENQTPTASSKPTPPPRPKSVILGSRLELRQKYT